MLDKNKLIGTNFLYWVKNLRIVLKEEKLAYVLDVPLLESPAIVVLKGFREHIKSTQLTVRGRGV